MKKTLDCLAKAFIGESMARNRYTMYSKIAKKEGFEQIAEIFLITADNEREHAAQIFIMIDELKINAKKFDALHVGAEVPTTYSTTAENLKAAIAGENYEHAIMYPEFAAIAKTERLAEVSDRLLAIAKAEEHHEERYLKLLRVVEDGTVFKKEIEVAWVCRECGYVHYGKVPPAKCPSCGHERAYYQVKCEEY